MKTRISKSTIKIQTLCKQLEHTRTLQNRSKIDVFRIKQQSNKANTAIRVSAERQQQKQRMTEAAAKIQATVRRWIFRTVSDVLDT